MENLPAVIVFHLVFNNINNEPRWLLKTAVSIIIRIYNRSYYKFCLKEKIIPLWKNIIMILLITMFHVKHVVEVKYRTYFSRNRRRWLYFEILLLIRFCFVACIMNQKSNPIAIMRILFPFNISFYGGQTTNVSRETFHNCNRILKAGNI